MVLITVLKAGAAATSAYATYALFKYRLFPEMARMYWGVQLPDAPKGTTRRHTPYRINQLGLFKAFLGAAVLTALTTKLTVSYGRATVNDLKKAFACKSKAAKAA